MGMLLFPKLTGAARLGVAASFGKSMTITNGDWLPTSAPLSYE
jgi:hypothetical protein